MYPFLERIAGLRRRPWFGYAFALIAFLVALELRFFFDPDLPAGYPFLTFFPAIILTSALGGTLPGILCTVLCFLSAWYWFIPPFGAFYPDAKVAFALAFFTIIAAVDITIIHWLHRSMEAVIAERRKSAELAKESLRLAQQKEILFAELQHRVANNLAIIASILSLEERKVADAEAKAILKDARRRLDLMSRVHRRLYSPETGAFGIGDYIERLTQDILDGAVSRPVVVEVQAAPLVLSVDQMTNLSLALLEVLMNSVKYAAPHTEELKVTISLQPTAEGQARLTVTDNGPGFPPDFNPAASRQLGFMLLKSFSQSLGGSMTFSNAQGAATRIDFPLTTATGV
ncbi:sensor histidine kinase [Ciceribacter selenitireducens]